MSDRDRLGVMFNYDEAASALSVVYHYSISYMPIPDMYASVTELNRSRVNRTGQQF